MAEGDTEPVALTAEAARDVKFREKLRGYHPDDVDDFVTDVANALETARARIAALEAQVAELLARGPEPSQGEEALRRTLVLAQRTADLAVQEARDEAARLVAEARAEHEAVTSEAADLRTRLHAEAEAEAGPVREHLLAERAALQADVDAITQYLDRERERLRIYFNDQLRRVDEGYPGLAPPPEMQAPAAPPAEAATVQAVAEDGAADGGDEAPPIADSADDDAFLAELRLAMTDEAPLGPRDDAEVPPGAPDDDDFDMFAPEEDDGGRFGGLRRRRR